MSSQSLSDLSGSADFLPSEAVWILSHFFSFQSTQKLIKIILFGLVQTKPIQSKTASLEPGPVQPSSGTGLDRTLPQTGSVRTGGIIVPDVHNVARSQLSSEGLELSKAGKICRGAKGVAGSSRSPTSSQLVSLNDGS